MLGRYDADTTGIFEMDDFISLATVELRRQWTERYERLVVCRPSGECLDELLALPRQLLTQGQASDRVSAYIIKNPPAKIKINLSVIALAPASSSSDAMPSIQKPTIQAGFKVESTRVASETRLSKAASWNADTGGSSIHTVFGSNKNLSPKQQIKSETVEHHSALVFG